MQWQMKPSLKHYDNKHYNVYVLSSNHNFSALAREIELQVFNESFGNDKAEIEKEYGVYEAKSIFILIVDNKHQKNVGMMRIIFNSDVGLKSLNDLERYWGKKKVQVCIDNELSLDKTWDIGSFAVSKEYRNSSSEVKTGWTILFYYMLFKLCVAHQIEFLIAILDDMVLNSSRRKGFELTVMKDVTSKEYLGSPSSTPVVLRVNEFEDLFKSSNYNYMLDEVLKEVASISIEYP